MQHAHTASLLTRCSPLHMPFFLYVFEITLYDLGGVECTASSLYSTLCIAHMRMLLYIFILLSSLVSHFVTRHFIVPPCALDDRANLI